MPTKSKQLFIDYQSSDSLYLKAFHCEEFYYNLQQFEGTGGSKVFYLSFEKKFLLTRFI